MLRDFPYTIDARPLRPVFDQFGIQAPVNLDDVALLKFEVISPDSFLWKILIGTNIYYLYAEDYVESLEYVKTTIQSLTSDDSSFEFIKVKKPKNFEKAGPVKAAHVYRPPDDVDEFMKYAADAGMDFAFLAKSQEDSTEAFFAK